MGSYSFRSLLALLFTASTVAATSTTCKCLPGQACFPTQPQWNALAANLTGNLISYQRPLAAPCYPDEFNLTACAEAASLDSFGTGLAHTGNALQWSNFEALINSTTVLECAFDPAPGDVCHQGRVPVYSVEVATVSDVQYTVRFASTHNLHLVVKNTGHELLGRAFGVGALELFTNGLKSINFSDTFVPVGAPAGTLGQYAATIGAGVEWVEIYNAAQAVNRSVAGGFSVNGTVGAAAGWPVGGGHSILSPFYGLGVDNVLEFSVVLPNASYVVANAFQNTDLFWALRGGGAPSFGVIISTTYKTHPNIPYTAAFFGATANTSTAYHALLTAWMAAHNAVADAGWGGAWPFFTGSLFLTMVTQGTPPTNPNANATMQAFFSAAAAIPGVEVTTALSVAYPSFWQFFHDNLDSTGNGFGLNFAAFPVAGARVFATSWLLPRNLTTPGNASTLADIFVQFPATSPFLVGGGAAAEVAPDATSITPAWRNTISDFAYSAIWNNTHNATMLQELKEQTHQMILPIQELAPIPIGGQYLNEPDALEEDWQAAQWGSNYPRLLSIKKAIDPYDLLIVRHGVNSEDWDEEIICKTT